MVDRNSRLTQLSNLVAFAGAALGISALSLVKAFLKKEPKSTNADTENKDLEMAEEPQGVSSEADWLDIFAELIRILSCDHYIVFTLQRCGCSKLVSGPSHLK